MRVGTSGKSLGIAIALIVLAGIHSDVAREARFDPARDSVTVRVYCKEPRDRIRSAADLDPEWDLDSVTVRALPDRAITTPYRWPSHGSYTFEVCDARSRDSLRVRPPRGLSPTLGRTSGGPGPGTGSLVTAGQACWWVTNNMTDASEFVGLRLIRTWPEARTQARPTGAVVGRVLDAASERPCGWERGARRRDTRPAVVHLAWSSPGAVADSMGYFTLHGVPSGWVKLNVIAEQHAPLSRLVHMPADTVVFKLLAGSPYDTGMYPAVAPPAAAIPIPIPEDMSTHPRARAPRPPPGIAGRWQGEIRSVAFPGLQGSRADAITCEFISPPDTCPCPPTTATWTLLTGQSPSSESCVVRQHGSPVLWRADLTGSGIPRHWHLEVRGDTLVGQLLDSSTRVLVRELRARRVAEPVATTPPRHPPKGRPTAFR